MKFELTKKDSLSNEAIIDEIKSVMVKVGKTTLTMKEFDSIARINSSTVIRLSLIHI